MPPRTSPAACSSAARRRETAGAARGEVERLHEPHTAGQQGAHDGGPPGGVRLREPAPEDRQGGKEVAGALPGARLPREGGDHRRRSGEHGSEQPSARVEPDPGTQHRFGEKGQRVRVVEQVGELRNDEDEHEEHRGEAGHDENGRIHQRAPDLGRGALVVLHLHDRLAERLREIPAQLARLHQVVDVVGKREPAGMQGGVKALPAQERPGNGVEGARERRMRAAAGLREHRIGQRHPGLEEGRKLMERHHLVREAGTAAERRAAGRLALVDLDHRVAFGAQPPDEVRDGLRLRLPLQELAAAVDDLVVVLRHRASILEREPRDLLDGGVPVRRLDETVLRQGAVALPAGQGPEIVELGASDDEILQLGRHRDQLVDAGPAAVAGPAAGVATLDPHPPIPEEVGRNALELLAKEGGRVHGSGAARACLAHEPLRLDAANGGRRRGTAPPPCR